MVACLSGHWVGSLPILRAHWLLRPGLHGLRGPCSYSPDQKCNPHLLNHLDNETVLAGPEGYVTQWWDVPSIVGLIVFILCTLFIRYSRGPASGEGSWLGAQSQK